MSSPAVPSSLESVLSPPRQGSVLWVAPCRHPHLCPLPRSPGVCPLCVLSPELWSLSPCCASLLPPCPGFVPPESVHSVLCVIRHPQHRCPAPDSGIRPAFRFLCTQELSPVPSPLCPSPRSCPCVVLVVSPTPTPVRRVCPLGPFQDLSPSPLLSRICPRSLPCTLGSVPVPSGPRVPSPQGHNDCPHRNPPPPEPSQPAMCLRYEASRSRQSLRSSAPCAHWWAPRLCAEITLPGLKVASGVLS